MICVQIKHHCCKDSRLDLLDNNGIVVVLLLTTITRRHENVRPQIRTPRKHHRFVSVVDFVLHLELEISKLFVVEDDLEVESKGGR